MAEVHVSREALTGIRAALNQFKTEMEGIPFSMRSHADALRSECESAVREQGRRVNLLKQQVLEKKAELRQLQNELDSARYQLERTGQEAKKTEQSLAGIEREIKMCSGELSALRAGLPSNDVNEQARRMQDVSAAESRLSTLKGHGAEAAEELRAQQEMIQKLSADIAGTQAALGRTESALRSLEAELSKQEDKQRRMNMAYQSLQSELNAFTDSVSRFSQNALAQTQQNMAGVDQCIQYIDDYLATNL